MDTPDSTRAARFRASRAPPAICYNATMRNLIVLAALLMSALAWALTPAERDAARAVIARFAGDEVARTLRLESVEAQDGRPTYEIADGGRTIRGSSAVALCKAFYMNAKAKGAGIFTWTGRRFDAARAFAPSPDVRVVAPFRFYQYLNVVTFGYTTPFWDEARWMEEIDWMALHGVDMPLATLATEAIMARVLSRLGLTDAEILDWMVGPAHLPWMRMGNISARPDAPMPRAWLEREVRLQHAVLGRMRSLGMTPIVPAFAGFVPQALTRVRPEAKLLRMSWSGFHAWFLSPDQPLFREIGRLFVEEWEKEFGPCSHYLADSFNEMSLPWKTEAETLDGLAHCGANVYGAITDANPDAIWVMQGWMFGYSRNIWTPARTQALLSRVPKDRALILDMAVNYNVFRWRNGLDWELLDGFFGVPWVWSTITNMGGKSLPGENLRWLANAHLDALASPKRGNLQGYGFAPEGIENNDLIYEFITDVGWSDKPTDLQAWLRNYAVCRYGAAPEGLAAWWEGLLAGAYGSQEPHPRFFWQLKPGGSKGSFRGGEQWVQATKAFAACAPELGRSPLYQWDLREAVAASAGVRLEDVLRAEAEARQSGDLDRAKTLQARATALFHAIDDLLRGHPTQDLRRWIAQARAAAEGDEALADRYETNARRLITVWGPPVNDYACKVWSGLVGSYYAPRYAAHWAGKGEAALNRAFVEERSPLRETGHTAPSEALALIEASAALAKPAVTQTIGQWSPSVIATEWRTLEWAVSLDDLRAARGVRFRYLRGRQRLDIAEVAVVADGKTVWSAKPDAFAGTPSRGNVIRPVIPADATDNNGCVLRARVRGHKSNDSAGVVELLRRD